jgi:hypothetical protein
VGIWDERGRADERIETGTICSLVYDIPNKKISTLLAFSQGHWEHPEEAHGDKRNPGKPLFAHSAYLWYGWWRFADDLIEDFKRWRGLAKIGTQTDRFLLNEQADILERFKGKGDLVPIKGDEETIWTGILCSVRSNLSVDG